MPGVKDSTVYSGPEGTVRKSESLSGIQFHAVRQTSRGPKGRYYDRERDAVNWLRKMAKAKA